MSKIGAADFGLGAPNSAKQMNCLKSDAVGLQFEVKGNFQRTSEFLDLNQSN